MSTTAACPFDIAQRNTENRHNMGADMTDAKLTPEIYGSDYRNPHGLAVAKARMAVGKSPLWAKEFNQSREGCRGGRSSGAISLSIQDARPGSHNSKRRG